MPHNYLPSGKIATIYLDAGRVLAVLLGVQDAPLHGYLPKVGIEAEVGKSVNVGIVAAGIILGEPLGNENGEILESCPERDKNT